MSAADMPEAVRRIIQAWRQPLVSDTLTESEVEEAMAARAARVVMEMYREVGWVSVGRQSFHPNEGEPAGRYVVYRRVER